MDGTIYSETSLELEAKKLASVAYRNSEKRKTTITAKMAARNNALRADIHENKLDIAAIAAKYHLSESQTSILRYLRQNTSLEADVTEVSRELHINRNTTIKWVRLFGYSSKNDIVHIKLEKAKRDLLDGDPTIRHNARANGLHFTTIQRLATKIGVKGHGRSRRAAPKTAAVEEQILLQPESGPTAIAKAAGTTKQLASKILKKKRDETKPLKAVVFLDAAEILVRRYLSNRPESERVTIEKNTKQAGIFAGLGGCRPWPASAGAWPGTSIPRRRYLDVALTEYMHRAGIRSAKDLETRAKVEHLCLDVPREILEAFHFAVSALGPSFDRSKVRNRQGKAIQPAPTRIELENLAKQLIESPAL